MKPFIASILAGAVILGTPALFPNTTQAALIGEIESSVSLRTGPDTDDRRIRYLKEGEEVTILEETNKWWYKVKDSYGNVGYISTNDKYINVSSSGSASGSTVNTGGSVGEIVSSVSMRTGPGTDYERIRYAQDGEKVTILSQPNRYWYEIRDRYGNIGYVSSNAKYINVNEGSVQTQTPSSSTSTVSSSVKVEKVIASGMKYLGTPYEYGSSRNNDSTFDCSDFVRTAIKNALGLTIPSSSRDQGDYVRDKGPTTTNWKNLKRGDLMFFMSYDGTSASNYRDKDNYDERITHVAIYLGDGKMIHTYSESSGGVRIDSIGSNHWEYRFLYGGSSY